MSLAPSTNTSSSQETEETDTQSINDYSHSRNLAYLINEVYRSRIVQDVDFGVLISYMPFMNAILPQIYNLRKTSPMEVPNIFFEHLKNVEEEGKYQSFVDALRRARYPLLVAALENNEIISNDHEHNQLISLFFNEIAETINAEVMSQQLQMKEVITAEEGEQIRKTARHSDNKSASFELLFKIPHRVINWYEIFLNLLFDNHHHTLLQKIDIKFYEKKMKDITDKTNGEVGTGEENSTGSEVSHTLVKTVSLTPHPVSQRSPVSPAFHSISQRSSVSPAPHPTTPQRSSVSPTPHPVSQRESKSVSSEVSERVLNELSDLKSLVLTQTQSLQTLLDKTELLFARVDRLEQKLDNLAKSGK